MGLPAPEYPLPPYRQTLAQPVVVAKNCTEHTAEDCSTQTSVQRSQRSAFAAFSVRSCRWSRKAAMDWPTLALTLSPLTYTVQEALEVVSVEQGTQQDVKFQHDTGRDTKQEVVQDMKQGVVQDTKQEVKFEHNTGREVQQHIKDEIADSEFSVPFSPMPTIVPSSATSDFSGSSLDSDYQDFCSRREAFLCQCCRLTA